MNKLMALKLDATENPKKLSGCIAKIMNKYRTKVDESQKVAVVVKCGGKQYSDAILQETSRIKAEKNQAVTANELN